MDSHRDPPHRKRLDSWKAISAFFGRDERTVKRWEGARGLPVHRMPGHGRSSVFAYADELAEWLDGSEQKLDGAFQGGYGVGEPTSRSDGAGAPPGGSVGVGGSKAEATQAPTPASEQRAYAERAPRWLLVLLGLAVLVACTAYFLESRAGHVRKNLAGTSSPAQRTHTSNTQAEELYLEGVYDWNKRTPESLNRAIDEYSQALRLDPRLAPAYAGLAECYLLLREFGAMPDAEAYARAEQAAQRALALDENLAEAHAALGFVDIYWHWDARGAQREYRRAIALNPDMVTAHHWYATSLFTMGRYREALAEIDRARELDAASSPILADRALIIAFAGQRQQAIRALQELEASDPGFLSAHAYLAEFHLDDGDERDYLREARLAATLRHDDKQLTLLDAAEKGFSAGARKGMFEAILDVQKRRYANGEESALALAQTYARLGDKADALRYLQIAWEQHEPALISLRNYTAFDPLHSDPAFQQLAARVWVPETPPTP